MSSRCNEVKQRLTANEAWYAVAGHFVGLYLATTEGIIFVKVPLTVWYSSIRRTTDCNGNVIPEKLISAVQQAEQDAEAIPAPIRTRGTYTKNNPEERERMRAIIDAYIESDLSVEETAKAAGISPSKFAYWKRKFEQEAAIARIASLSISQPTTSP